MAGHLRRRILLLGNGELQTGGQTRHLTLTRLAWESDKRAAQVHDEGPGSPPVGRFEGTGGQGEIKGTLVSGHSVYKVEFRRDG